jgi:hypothetical protein
MAWSLVETGERRGEKEGARDKKRKPGRRTVPIHRRIMDGMDHGSWIMGWSVHGQCTIGSWAARTRLAKPKLSLDGSGSRSCETGHRPDGRTKERKKRLTGGSVSDAGGAP